MKRANKSLQRMRWSVTRGSEALSSRISELGVPLPRPPARLRPRLYRSGAITAAPARLCSLGCRLASVGLGRAFPARLTAFGAALVGWQFSFADGAGFHARTGDVRNASTSFTRAFSASRRSLIESCRIAPLLTFRLSVCVTLPAMKPSGIPMIRSLI